MGDIIILQQKLYENTIHFVSNNREYYFLNRYLDFLKSKYQEDQQSHALILSFDQHLQTYKTSKHNYFTSCIGNIRDEILLKELISFFDRKI